MPDVLGGVLRSQRRLEVAVLEQGGEFYHSDSHRLCGGYNLSTKE